MIAKPTKTIELHYPVIQFLIICFLFFFSIYKHKNNTSKYIIGKEAQRSQWGLCKELP